MKREDVRHNFPECIKIADEFKRQFGKIRLVYVNENGRELGKKSETGVRIGTVRGDAFCNGRKRKTGV